MPDDGHIQRVRDPELWELISSVAQAQRDGQPPPMPAPAAEDRGMPGSVRWALREAADDHKARAVEAGEQTRLEAEAAEAARQAELDVRITERLEPIVAEQAVMWRCGDDADRRLGRLETIVESICARIVGLIARVWNSRGAGRPPKRCEEIKKQLAADVAAGRITLDEVLAHPTVQKSYDCNPKTLRKAATELLNGKNGSFN
jgi:hypothetical protein